MHSTMKTALLGLIALTLHGGLSAAAPATTPSVVNEDIVLLVSKTDSEADFDGVQIFQQGTGICNPSSAHVAGFKTALFAEIINIVGDPTIVPSCRAWQNADCTGASSAFFQNNLTALSTPPAGNVGGYSCP